MGKGLTKWQVEEYIQLVPEVIRAVYHGEPTEALKVSIVGMGAAGPARLCHPISPEVLRRMHACQTVRWQDVDVTHISNPGAEEEGWLTFRVRYDFEGMDADGNALIVQEEGAVTVRCSEMAGMSGRRCICGVEPCAMTADGDVRLPATEGRRKAARAAEEVGGCCLEGLLEAALELILELFDG